MIKNVSLVLIGLSLLAPAASYAKNNDYYARINKDKTFTDYTTREKQDWEIKKSQWIASQPLKHSNPANNPHINITRTVQYQKGADYSTREKQGWQLKQESWLQNQPNKTLKGREK